MSLPCCSKNICFFFCNWVEKTYVAYALWFLWAFLLFSGKIFVIFIIVTLQGGGIRKRNALPLEWSCLVAAESYLHILLKCISSWLWLIQQTLLNWHPQSPATGKTKKNAHYQWFCYLCVLPPWHIKIPKMQIIRGMGLVGCKDQFIDRSEDVFFIEYPVGVISVAVLVAVVKRPLFLLVFVVLYNRRSIFLFH